MNKRAVAARSVAVLAACLTIGSAVVAAPRCAVPDAEQQEQLLRELISWPQGMESAIADLSEANDITPLTFDAPIEWYWPSDAFITGAVTQSLESELYVADDMVLMPVRRDGDLVGVLEAFRSLPEPWRWYMGSAMGQECAIAVMGLQSSERLLRDIRGDQKAYWIVRGAELEALTPCNMGGPPPEVSTLADYQEYVFSFRAPAEGYYGGGGTTRQGSAGSGHASPGSYPRSGLLIAAIAATAAVGALSLRLKRRP